MVAVLLFHAGKLRGGYLGVDLFFVLSGFLITSLLLAESRTAGRVKLLSFWARRARRLLPALLLVVAFVGLYSAVIADPTELHRIRGDAFATLAYIANWRFVFGGFDYFALFTSPSPLNHTWSLAIEEQFYFLWPLAFVGLLAWRRTRQRDDSTDPDTAARLVFLCSTALAILGATLALGLWFWTHDATRIYYGTDTRAPAILVGAALAGFLAWRGPARNARMRRAVELGAWCGAAVLAAAWIRLDGANLYRGGLLVCAIAAGAVIAAAAHPEPGPLARALSVRPFVGLGIISYGVYLWHWPIYLWLNPDRVGLSGWPLLAVRLAVTLAVATVSFVTVERPIRQGALSTTTLRWLTPVSVAIVGAITVLAATGYASPNPASAAGITDARSGARYAGTLTRPTRLMVVGNSVGYFLAADGFSTLRSTPPLVTLNAGRFACVYPDGERLRIADVGPESAPIPCDGEWRADVREFMPDVVLMIFSDSAGGELLHNHRWLSSCDPGFRSWYLQTLEDSTRLLTARGAHVVMTTGAYSEVFGVAQDVRRQTDCKNVVTREFATAHPEVGFVDLAAFVCPTRSQCRVAIDGVALRQDGVHFKGASARLVARWLLARIGIDVTGGRSSGP